MVLVRPGGWHLRPPVPPTSAVSTAAVMPATTSHPTLLASLPASLSLNLPISPPLWGRWKMTGGRQQRTVGSENKAIEISHIRLNVQIMLIFAVAVAALKL